MPLPELTPEQLEQLNAISGLGKTRKRKDAPSGDNLPDVAPADLMQTALQQDDNAGFEPFSLPERTPDMDNEVYEGLIKESLQQQLGAIYDRARQRADANRTKMLAPFDEAIEADIPAWKKAFIAQAKSSTLRSPSGLGGDDTYLMQATERALKLLNQKTVKDKQAGDKSSGIAREVFDWGTLGDLATMGFGELGENIAITRALSRKRRTSHTYGAGHDRPSPVWGTDKPIHGPTGRANDRRKGRQRYCRLITLYGGLRGHQQDRQQRSQHPRQNAAQKGSENALGERASQAGRIHGERGCNDTLTGGYLLKLP